MKKFTALLFLLVAFSMPQTSYADSCSLTKTLYKSGKFQRAFKQAKTYATYNNPCAEFYLGLMYLNGEGVKMNAKKGDELIQSAAKHGYQEAIDFLENRPF